MYISSRAGAVATNCAEGFDLSLSKCVLMYLIKIYKKYYKLKLEIIPII